MPQWQRNVYAIWVAQFLAMVGLTLIVPFLPFYLRTLGVATTEDVERWSGFLFAAPFLVQTLAAPLWGVLGDRYGRKMMVLRAMLGIGVTNMLSAAVGNAGQLVALRAVQGGVSGFVAAGNALVTATIPPDRMGAALGLLQTSLTGGGIIGPLVGGALADLVGHRAVFVITGAMCWIAAVVVARGAREEVPAAHAEALRLRLPLRDLRARGEAVVGRVRPAVPLRRSPRGARGLEVGTTRKAAARGGRLARAGR